MSLPGILPALFLRVTLTFRLEEYFPFLINTSVGGLVNFGRVYVRTSCPRPCYQEH